MDFFTKSIPIKEGNMDLFFVKKPIRSYFYFSVVCRPYREKKNFVKKCESL
jgi:hypothetical protein